MVFSLNLSKLAYASSYEKQCGDYVYGVMLSDGPEECDKQFDLYSRDKENNKKIFYKIREYIYLTAACIQDKNGKFLFLFQEFCGSNSCPDDLNGVFDPEKQKMVLTPKDKDNEVVTGNSKELNELIGYSLPFFMADDKRTFCCDYNQSPMLKKKV
jgi:hypothetical protein